MHYTRLPAAIARGALDSIIDELADAVLARKRVLSDMRGQENRTLPMGTRVELTGLRPKYLNGSTGEIVPDGPMSRSGYINVMLDDSSFAFVNMKSKRIRSQNVCVPAQCVKQYASRIKSPDTPA